MSNSIYKADDDVYQIMRDLIGQYHPDLALVSDQIGIVFREKAGSKGGKPVYGTVRKATPLLGVFGDIDYKFVLELAADEWASNLSSRQKKALIDHLLCACRTEEGDDGSVKCNLAPPDVSFYYDELDRWGDWRPRPADAPDGPSVVEEKFKRKEGANASDSESDELDDGADLTL